MRSVAMDEDRMNHYEKQLYTVFKTFDVNNEEALDRAAVLQLCDALQLEARGAALVDSLFERRAERVTFASFRNGLLGVLGAAPPEPEPAPAEPAPTLAPVLSDEDSSGREVAPKFVVGAKKYGRRSRPARGGDEPGTPRAASASRADCSPRSRTRFRRSASAMEGRAGDARLDHDRRIDAAQAVALCRELRMDGIDPRLVERMFEDLPGAQTTVGEFFDRLNAALTSLAAAGAAPDEDEEMLPGAAVAEAWERAGVRRPRRLLAELGLDAAALRPRDLERALDDELRTLGPPPDERLDARPLLQLAALSVSRLRLGRAQARAAAAVAERDKLRADLAEANRRAQLLAQDVDENHARLEAERATALRQIEARYAETARAAADEGAVERERAAAARAALEAETARRVELEARLRAELAALSARAEELERRASAADERAAAAEKDRSRAEEEARIATAQVEAAGARADEAATALVAARERHAAEAARLRDRADELTAALEARAPAAPPAPAADTSWREEAGLDSVTPDHIEETDSSPVSMERSERRDAAAQTDADERAARHDAEKNSLHEVIAGLEAGLEALRVEYEQCEEYWAGKLADERAGAEADAAAADQRLADLLRRVADCERAMTLPALPESALEPQYNQLEQEFEAYKAEAGRELATARERSAALERELAALRAAPPPPPPPAPTPAPAPALPCACQQSAVQNGGRRAASDGASRRAHLGEGECAGAGAGAGAGGARRSVSAGPRPPAPPARAPHGHAMLTEKAGAGAGGCACAALWAGWRVEAGGLRARAAHAERAAARLLARLHAADALVADLYRENCQLQHPCARLL